MIIVVLFVWWFEILKNGRKYHFAKINWVNISRAMTSCTSNFAKLATCGHERQRRTKGGGCDVLECSRAIVGSERSQSFRSKSPSKPSFLRRKNKTNFESNRIDLPLLRIFSWNSRDRVGEWLQRKLRKVNDIWTVKPWFLLYSSPSKIHRESQFLECSSENTEWSDLLGKSFR